MNELVLSLSYTPLIVDINHVKSLPQSELPKISVVIPSFNQARYLPQTIDSVLSQNYPNMEIFVADGSSRDNSIEILENYQKSHKSLFRFVSEPDNGQYHAVNKGIAATDGDIIAWINSDDVYLPETFWKVATFFYFNRCAMVAYGRNKYTDEKLSPIVDYWVDWSPILREQKRKMMHHCLPPQPSLFFRRICSKLLGKLESPILDYELWLRWQQDVQFYFINDYLSLSRLHSEAQTVKDTKRILRGIVETVHQYYGTVPYSWTLKQAHCEKYGNIISPDKPAPFTRAIRLKAIYYWLYYNFRWAPRTVVKILVAGKKAIRESLRGNVFSV